MFYWFSQWGLLILVSVQLIGWLIRQSKNMYFYYGQIKMAIYVIFYFADSLRKKFFGLFLSQASFVACKSLCMLVRLFLGRVRRL